MTEQEKSDLLALVDRTAVEMLNLIRDMADEYDTMLPLVSLRQHIEDTL